MNKQYRTITVKYEDMGHYVKKFGQIYDIKSVSVFWNPLEEELYATILYQ